MNKAASDRIDSDNQRKNERSDDHLGRRLKQRNNDTIDDAFHFTRGVQSEGRAVAIKEERIGLSQIHLE